MTRTSRIKPLPRGRRGRPPSRDLDPALKPDPELLERAQNAHEFLKTDNTIAPELVLAMVVWPPERRPDV